MFFDERRKSGDGRKKDCSKEGKMEIEHKEWQDKDVKNFLRRYITLKEQGYCSTCKYNNIGSGEGDADTGCNGSDKWKWAGDEE